MLHSGIIVFVTVNYKAINYTMQKNYENNLDSKYNKIRLLITYKILGKA